MVFYQWAQLNLTNFCNEARPRIQTSADEFILPAFTFFDICKQKCSATAIGQSF